MITEKEIKAAIVEALTKKSARELADVLEVAPNTIKRWADGSSVPHPFARESIMKVLNAAVVQLEDTAVSETASR